MDAESAIKLMLKHVPGYFEQELPDGGEWRPFSTEVHDGEKWRRINGQARREGSQVHLDSVTWSDVENKP